MKAALSSRIHFASKAGGRSCIPLTVYTKNANNAKGAVPPHSPFCLTALLSFSGPQSLRAGVRVPRLANHPQQLPHRSSGGDAPWNGRFLPARNAFCFPCGSLRDSLHCLSQHCSAGSALSPEKTALLYRMYPHRLRWRKFCASALRAPLRR